MSESLNAIVAPDGYTSASTIEGVRIKRVILDVANQAIFWQLKLPTGAGQGNWEGTEQYMLPGSRAILEPCVGIRIRAVIPLASIPAGSHQAVVTARAIT